MTDRRRYGVIEVGRINAETYHLTIDGEMWSEVEWSRSRQAWCIQDAAGHCLTHVEHIVGQDRDVQTAIRLAKKMIISGEMPTPEDAQLEQDPDEAVLDRIEQQHEAAYREADDEYSKFIAEMDRDFLVEVKRRKA
jgi:hypothetical protein